MDLVIMAKKKTKKVKHKCAICGLMIAEKVAGRELYLCELCYSVAKNDLNRIEEKFVNLKKV